MRAAKLQESWRKIIGDNAVIRTDDRLDGMVKHLGYQSVSVDQRIRDKLTRVITTDKELIKRSQQQLRKTQIIPDEKLEYCQLTHIKLSRVITAYVFNIPPQVFVAIIPPASDRVRTAGMYATSGAVYISLEMIERGRSMIDTLVHELAHHKQYCSTGIANDLTATHFQAMTDIASEVVRLVTDGELDYLLKEVVW